MRRLLGALIVTVFGLVGLAGFASVASAHPLGSATINHAVSVTVDTQRIEIGLVVDLAEIPSAQRRSDLDIDGDGTFAAAELEGFATRECAARVDQIEVKVDGDAKPPALAESVTTESPGDAGLATLRTECTLFVDHDLNDDGEHRIAIANNGDVGRSGWREITAIGRGGVGLRTELPVRSPSDQLRAYPADDPTGPDLVSGELVFWLADSSSQDSGIGLGDDSGISDTQGEVAASTIERSSDPLTGLLAQAGDGPSALALSLIVAAAIGAGHGLAPGHGKTVIAAYLVGTNGSRPQAAGLALAVASSHTLGVFVLGAITLVASNTFAPDALYPWLRAVSAAIILGIGLTLLYRAVIERSHLGARGNHDHGDHGHDHDDAGHDHSHGADGHHDHDHGGHEHHDHGSGFHVHGIIPHRHRTDWSNLDTSETLSWRTLAGLGLAGGLVPSTSAVLVLLGAVQLGKIGLGAALVIAFGIGMSIALVSVGLGLVTVAQATGRRFDLRSLSARWQGVLTPIAAFVIVAVGSFLSIRAAQDLFF